MSLYGETTEAKRLQVDATSLADLKAELFRKKGEAVKNKLQGNYRPEKAQNKGDKKTNIWSKENTGVIARNMRDMEKRKEEERSMERVRYMLQKKEGLYNSLKKGKGNSVIADNFLVNFAGRNDSDSDDDTTRDYPATRDGDQWVEYVDALGRTRTCMKKDLPNLKKQDKEMVREDTVEPQETGQGLRKEEPDMLSADVRMDDLRQKWEQQELENLEKSNLHYSDVRFDEARAHGAGFYNFSREEEKRVKEQDTLRKFHEESEETRKQKEKKADRKKKEMADRIKKIKAKKRQKLGLQPLSDDESDNETKCDDSDSEGDPNEDISKSVMEGLKMFRRDNEEMERQRNSAMRVASSTSRDWDKAKEVQEDDLGRSKEWKVMSQDQWVDKKRIERTAEFAPPSAYSEARFLIKNREESLAQAQAEKRKNVSQPSQPPVKKTMPNKMQPPQDWGYPPPNMQYPPPGPSYSVPYYAPPPPPPGVMPSNPPPTLDPMAVLDAGSSQTSLFSEDRNPDPSLLESTSAQPSITTKATSYSKCVRMELHKRMKNQDFLPPPSNNGGLNSKILEAFNESDSDDDEDTNRGSGAEVAPPCDMEYYNYTGGVKTDRSGYRSHHDMADAFNAGLKAKKKE